MEILRKKQTSRNRSWRCRSCEYWC